MAAEELICEDPYDITQYIRGTLFTLVDNLMVQQTYDKQELLQVYRFFDYVLQFIVKWLQVASRNLAAYYKALQNPELYLTDALAAVLMSRNEVFITLQRLFMQEERTSRFFKMNEISLEKNENFIFAEQGEPKMPYFLINMINHFGIHGGFQAFIDLLKQPNVPIDWLMQIPVGCISKYLKNNFGTRFIGKYKDLVFQRLENLEDKEIKDINK